MTEDRELELLGLIKKLIKTLRYYADIESSQCDKMCICDGGALAMECLKWVET